MNITLDSFSSYEYRTSIIKVFSYDRKLLQGTLHNPYFPETIYFENISQLLFILDDLRHNIKFPESTMECRFFCGDGTPVLDFISTAVPEDAKPIATFALKLLFCNNASWQGTISWLDKRVETAFRSVLELIMLLDSVLESV